MTDARDRLATIIGKAWLGGDYESGDDRPSLFKEATAILVALNLTPSAASALMDGAATVVPSGRLTDEQVNKLGFALHDGTNYPPDNAPFARGSHRAVIAALAYRGNGDEH